MCSWFYQHETQICAFYIENQVFVLACDIKRRLANPNGWYVLIAVPVKGPLNEVSVKVQYTAVAFSNINLFNIYFYLRIYTNPVQYIFNKQSFSE